MTPEIRKMILSKLMLESDRGCPSGFRAHMIEEPTEQEMIERLAKAKLPGSVMREENYRHGRRKA